MDGRSSDSTGRFPSLLLIVLDDTESESNQIVTTASSSSRSCFLEPLPPKPGRTTATFGMGIQMAVEEEEEEEEQQVESSKESGFKVDGWMDAWMLLERFKDLHTTRSALLTFSDSPSVVVVYVRLSL